MRISLRVFFGALGLLGVSIASVAAADWVPRPEGMHQLWLHDIDVRNGRLRVLYTTSPSLPQGRGDDWSFNVYLVEAGGESGPTQHRIYSGQAERYNALSPLALRRGRDEVVLQIRDDALERGLETRRLPAGDVLGRAGLPPGIGSGPFKGTTAGGNVVWVRVHTGPDRDRTVGTIEWREVAPDGKIASRGELRRPGARLQVLGTFAPPDGGIGLVMSSASKEGPALAHRQADSVDHSVGDRTITMNVSGETRLLIIGPDGEALRFGPPLAQEVRWSGEKAIPQDLPYEQAMAQNRRQMSLQQQAAADHRARRSLLEGLKGARIRATPNGYATLVDATVARRLDPPAHGWYFVEVGPDALQREIRLEPLFDELDAEPVDVHVIDEKIHVLAALKRPRGERIGSVLVLDEHGERISARPVTRGDGQHVELEAMRPGGDGFWIVGTGHDPEAENAAVWIRHVSL